MCASVNNMPLANCVHAARTTTTTTTTAAAAAATTTTTMTTTTQALWKALAALRHEHNPAHWSTHRTTARITAACVRCVCVVVVVVVVILSCAITHRLLLLERARRAEPLC